MKTRTLMGLLRILIRGYRKMHHHRAGQSTGLLHRILVGLYMKYLQMTNKKSVVATVDGITYDLDMTEIIDTYILCGYWEPDSTAVINNLVKEGMTVIDIGANIGAHTLRLAKLVSGKGRVFAFEPTSSAFSRLMRNIGLNNFNNIIPEKIALSDTYMPNQLVCINSSYPIAADSPKNVAKEFINFTTLDDYVRAKGIEKIDFIKLDVDGYEHKIIRSALEVIRKFKPLILLELGVENLESVGDNIVDMVNTLSNLGYKFYSEKGLTEFSSTDAMIKSIPKFSTVNVLLSVSDLG